MSESDYYNESDEIISTEEETPNKKTVINKKKETAKVESLEEVNKKLDKLKELLEYKKRPEIKELEKKICKEELLRNQENKGYYLTVEDYKEGLRKRAEAVKIKVNKRGKYKKQKTIDYLFVTINPIECEITELKNIIERLDNKEIKICSYIFEQRGETDDEIGKGKHIHMLIKKRNSISYYKRRILSMLRKTELIEYQESINIIEVTNKEGIDYYMQGKKAPEKLTKMKYTKIWREQNKLKDIYIVRGEINKYTEPNIKSTKKEVDYITIDDDHYIVVEVNNKKITIKLDNNI